VYGGTFLQTFAKGSYVVVIDATGTSPIGGAFARRARRLIEDRVHQAARVCRRVDRQVLVAQHIVQQMLQPLLAEHRRVHLNDDI